MDEFLDWAPLASATVAALAAFLAYRQTHNALRVATLQSLQEFFKAVVERERALANAGTDKERIYAFNEYLDCLELYAAACNGRLFRTVAKEIVHDKLVDTIVVLENSPQWHGRIQEAITSPIAYIHLRKFAARNRPTINSRRTAALNVSG